MGTQQVLLIVLTVIIVGVAVAGGIGMFNKQLESQNRQALIADMNYLAAQAIAYYRLPKTSGGGGNEIRIADFKQWLSMPTNNSGNRVLTENGSIRIHSNNSNELLFTAFGNEMGQNENKAVKARLFLKEIDSAPRLRILN